SADRGRCHRARRHRDCAISPTDRRKRLGRPFLKTPGRDALDAERDRLVEFVVAVLLVLLLEQPHRPIELRPTPDDPRSDVRDEAAESAPLLEIVIARE